MIIPYVAPVYNHIASQGYQEDVHFEPLWQGLFAFCNKQDIPAWKAPPDQYDWSVSPTIPPASKPKSLPVKAPEAKSGPAKKPVPQPKPVKATKVTKPVKEAKAPAPTKDTNPLAPVKGKGKMKEVVDDTSGSEFEPEETEDKQPKEPHPVPCKYCQVKGYPCLINPSTIGKKNPACLKCFSWKLGCSFCGHAKEEDEEVDPESKTAKKGKGKKVRVPCKKMPVPVLGGEPGEY